MIITSARRAPFVLLFAALAVVTVVACWPAAPAAGPAGRPRPAPAGRRSAAPGGPAAGGAGSGARGVGRDRRDRRPDAAGAEHEHPDRRDVHGDDAIHGDRGDDAAAVRPGVCVVAGGAAAPSSGWSHAGAPSTPLTATRCGSRPRAAARATAAGSAARWRPARGAVPAQRAAERRADGPAVRRGRACARFRRLRCRKGHRGQRLDDHRRGGYPRRVGPTASTTRTITVTSATKYTTTRDHQHRSQGRPVRGGAGQDRPSGAVTASAIALSGETGELHRTVGSSSRAVAAGPCGPVSGAPPAPGGAWLTSSRAGAGARRSRRRRKTGGRAGRRDRRRRRRHRLGDAEQQRTVVPPGDGDPRECQPDRGRRRHAGRASDGGLSFRGPERSTRSCRGRRPGPGRAGGRHDRRRRPGRGGRRRAGDRRQGAAEARRRRGGPGRRHDRQPDAGRRRAAPVVPRGGGTNGTGTNGAARRRRLRADHRAPSTRAGVSGSSPTRAQQAVVSSQQALDTAVTAQDRAVQTLVRRCAAGDDTTPATAHAGAGPAARHRRRGIECRGRHPAHQRWRCRDDELEQPAARRRRRHLQLHRVDPRRAVHRRARPLGRGEHRTVHVRGVRGDHWAAGGRPRPSRLERALAALDRAAAGRSAGTGASTRARATAPPPPGASGTSTRSPSSEQRHRRRIGVEQRLDPAGRRRHDRGGGSSARERQRGHRDRATPRRRHQGRGRRRHGGGARRGQPRERDADLPVSGKVAAVALAKGDRSGARSTRGPSPSSAPMRCPSS